MSRIMYWPLPLLILLLSVLSTARADKVQVFDIRKNLQMTNKDSIFKDYYLTGGRNVGLRENMIVTVYRINPLHDHLRNEPRGQLKFRVGQLKILVAGETNSIARTYKLADHKSSPVVEFESFLIGDVVELTDAYIEKEKSAATEPSEAVPDGSSKTESKEANAPAQHSIELKSGDAEVASRLAIPESERKPADQKTAAPALL